MIFIFPVDYFFALEKESLSHLFEGCQEVWEALTKLPEAIKQMTASPQILGEVHPTAVLKGAVHVGKGTVIGPHVYIEGPVFIGESSELRQGAYLRPYCIIGDECVVGHDTEVKASIMLKKSHAPHFAYVGDSILGYEVNLGAGTKLANFKLQGDRIFIKANGTRIATGMRKLGAIIGDGSQVGCNAVTAPGTLIGKNSWVYSALSVNGFIPSNSIVKPHSGFSIEPKR